MTSIALHATALATALALVGLGGGLYEFSVVDAVWPRRPDIIQPGRGGVLRRRFWIPAHVAFELALVVSLVAAWSRPEVRTWLLVAVGSHAAMRVWSTFYFIPKALAFEKADTAGFDERPPAAGRGAACSVFHSISSHAEPCSWLWWPQPQLRHDPRLTKDKKHPRRCTSAIQPGAEFLPHTSAGR
jgi:hypothetical protein